jgi:hypothetical protein
MGLYMEPVEITIELKIKIFIMQLLDTVTKTQPYYLERHF